MRDVEGAKPIGQDVGGTDSRDAESAEFARRRSAHVGANPPLVARSFLLLAAWSFFVQMLAVRAFVGGLLTPPPGVVIEPCRIDVNQAGAGELQALPSVGPSRAEALVLERIRHGPFADLADLSRVHGLGPETLAGLAEFVCFDS